MRAKKVSRVVGFVFAVAAMGGIGAAAWGGETQPAPAKPVVVETPTSDLRPSPSVRPMTPPGKIQLFDSTWG